MSPSPISVAFRVDASVQIGFGHVKRCLSLAQALREFGASVTFITRRLGIDTASQISADGFPVHALPTPQETPAPSTVPHGAWAAVSAETDAVQTTQAIAHSRHDWIVVDHYSFDAVWHRHVGAATGSRIAVIDDVADRALACDLLVDHNLAEDHAIKYASRLDPGTVILGGPSYALLGPAYARAPKYQPRERVESIGIFMGGADAPGHSTRALAACRMAFDGPIEVVSTSGNPHLPELARAVRIDARSTLSLDLPDLSAFFARHDLQVGAGGGATWERCCIGAPTVAIVAAENQRSVLTPLQALGAVALASPAPASIESVVSQLLHDPHRRLQLSACATRLVDGRGTRRVARHLIDLCSPSASSAPIPGTR